MTLSDFVFSKALAEMEKLNKIIATPITFSLNLSPYLLQDLDFPDKLIALVNQSKIKPENIIIEITESGILKNLSSALDIFTRLRLKKIRLSIDDFGTGYAMALRRI